MYNEAMAGLSKYLVRSKPHHVIKNKQKRKGAALALQHCTISAVCSHAVRDFTFIGELSGGSLVSEQEHLACFVGGMLALGASTGEWRIRVCRLFRARRVCVCGRPLRGLCCTILDRGSGNVRGHNALLALFARKQAHRLSCPRRTAARGRTGRQPRRPLPTPTSPAPARRLRKRCSSPRCFDVVLCYPLLPRALAQARVLFCFFYWRCVVPLLQSDEYLALARQLASTCVATYTEVRTLPKLAFSACVFHLH